MLAHKILSQSCLVSHVRGKVDLHRRQACKHRLQASRFSESHPMGQYRVQRWVQLVPTMSSLGGIALRDPCTRWAVLTACIAATNTMMIRRTSTAKVACLKIARNQITRRSLASRSISCEREPER